MLTRKQIALGLRERGRDAPASRYMESDIAIVGPDQALEGIVSEALQKAPAVAVLDPSDRLLGYITLQNLLETMMIAEAPRKSGRRQNHPI